LAEDAGTRARTSIAQLPLVEASVGLAAGGVQPRGADLRKRLSFAGVTDCTPAGVDTSTLAIVEPDLQPGPTPGLGLIDATTAVSTTRPFQPTTVTGTVTTAVGRSRLQAATTLATGW
jgi:hypothetical protein